MYWVTGLVGLLLIAAPYTLGYSNDAAALWSSLILGVIIVGVSLVQALLKDVNNWEYWVAGIGGLLAVIAPFALGFSVLVTATWTTVVLGLIVLLLAGYAVFFARPQAR